MRGTEDLHGLQTLKTPPLPSKILLACPYFFLGQRLLGALSQFQNLTHGPGLGNWPGHLLQALIDGILRDIPLSLLPWQNHPPSTLWGMEKTELISVLLGLVSLSSGRKCRMTVSEEKQPVSVACTCLGVQSRPSMVPHGPMLLLTCSSAMYGLCSQVHFMVQGDCCGCS